MNRLQQDSQISVKKQSTHKKHWKWPGKKHKLNRKHATTLPVDVSEPLEQTLPTSQTTRVITCPGEHDALTSHRHVTSVGSIRRKRSSKSRWTWDIRRLHWKRLGSSKRHQTQNNSVSLTETPADKMEDTIWEHTASKTSLINLPETKLDTVVEYARHTMQDEPVDMRDLHGNTMTSVQTKCGR
jgi:hypothetical protein